MTKPSIRLLYKIMFKMTPSEFALFCDQVCFIALCTVVVCVPFTIAGVEIFFTISLIAFLLKKIAMRDRTLPLSKPACFIMFAFLISVCASFLRSEYLDLSFRGYIRWWKGFLLLIIVTETLTNETRMIIFIKTLIVMLGVSSLDGLFQLAVGRDFLRWQDGVQSHYGYMIRAGFGHYNNYSAYLTALIPVSLVLFLSKLRLTRKGLLAELAILSTASVALWYAKSRSGMVALFFSLCLFAAIFRIKIYWLYLLLWTIVTLVCWTYWQTGSHYERNFVQETVEQQDKQAPNPLKDFSERKDSGRFAMWADALSLAKERPFFGFGPNTFLRYYQTKNRETYAHNSYLQMLVELGAVGLLLFFMFLAQILMECFRTARRAQENTHLVMSIGFLTAVSTFLIHAFFDHDFYVLVLAALFWSLLGVALSCAKLQEAEYKHQIRDINPKH